MNEILDNPVQNLSNQSDEKVQVQFKYNGNSNIIYSGVLIYVLIYLLLRSLFKTIKTKTWKITFQCVTALVKLFKGPKPKLQNIQFTTIKKIKLFYRLKSTNST